MNYQKFEEMYNVTMIIYLLFMMHNCNTQKTESLSLIMGIHQATLPFTLCFKMGKAKKKMGDIFKNVRLNLATSFS